MITIFIKGFGIGFVVAAIVGPIALLCIRRTLSEGQAVGLAVGLGAAIADVVFAVIAGLGLTLISDFLTSYQVLLRVLGGIFLLYLGIKTFFEKPVQKVASVDATGLIGTTLSTFFLTLTNPVTIFSFTGIFVGLGIAPEATSMVPVALLASGVFLGCMTWWTILTSFLRLFHARMNHTTLLIINRSSGALIALFGLAALASLLVINC